VFLCVCYEILGFSINLFTLHPNISPPSPPSPLLRQPPELLLENYRSSCHPFPQQGLGLVFDLGRSPDAELLPPPYRANAPT
jgi:hypothetical protein